MLICTRDSGLMKKKNLIRILYLQAISMKEIITTAFVSIGRE